MAKALLGHVGVGTDMRLAAEVRRLRARVRELESELARSRSVAEDLAARIDVSDELRALDAEPMLSR